MSAQRSAQSASNHGTPWSSGRSRRTCSSWCAASVWSPRCWCASAPAACATALWAMSFRRASSTSCSASMAHLCAFRRSPISWLRRPHSRDRRAARARLRPLARQSECLTERVDCLLRSAQENVCRPESATGAEKPPRALGLLRGVGELGVTQHPVDPVGGEGSSDNRECGTKRRRPVGGRHIERPPLGRSDEPPRSDRIAEEHDTEAAAIDSWASDSISSSVQRPSQSRNVSIRPRPVSSSQCPSAILPACARSPLACA